MVSFTYGTGFPCLWSHANLRDATHDWIEGEFAEVPFTFFAQMAESVRRGHLVSVGRSRRQLPRIVRRRATARPTPGSCSSPASDNHCFLPESQERTFEFLDGHRRGYHALHVAARLRPPRRVPRRDAADIDVFPTDPEELMPHE